MNKLTKKQKEFLKRKSDKYHQLRSRIRNRLFKRKLRKIILARSKKAKKPRIRTVTIKAPKYLEIGSETTRKEIITMLKSIKVTLSKNNNVKISFDETKKLFPSGTLFFISELEELFTKYPDRITSNYPKDDIVEQLFQHIGTLEKLGLQSRKKISAENVKHWHYLKGTSTDTTDFKGLFAAYTKEIKIDIQSGLYDSMVEAVDNSIEHAFEDYDNNQIQEKKWWMFSQLIDEKITFVICDLGVGIPKTIQAKPELIDYFKRSYWQLKKKKDAGLIEIAVNSKKSRTKLSHRGKGLPDMLEFAKDSKMGKFLIHSYRGCFYYDANENEENSVNYKTAIPGTLIQWEIPLRKA